MKPCGPVPLISPWLYRLRVKQVVRRVATGDFLAVIALAEILCTSKDPTVRILAREGLKTHLSVEQADTLCREVILRDHPELTKLVLERGYLPAGTDERALFFFYTSRIEELLLMDPEDHLPVLAAAYAAAPGTIQAQVRTAAGVNGTRSLLARVLTGTDITQHAGTWSYDEWMIVLNGYTRDRRWDDLWLLAVLAPVPLTITAISAMKEAGWKPEGDDLVTWNEIVAALPDRWTWPVPAGQAREPSGRSAGQVTRICFSPDGSLFATGSCDGKIQVFHTAAHRLVTELSAGSGSVCFLWISADNRHIVTGCDDGAVQCRSLPDQNRIWLWGGARSATALCISENSVLLADEQGNLHIHDAREGRATQAGFSRDSPVTYLACAPDRSLTASGHADGSVAVLRHGDRCAKILVGNGDPVRSVTFSPDGRECLAVYEQALPAHWEISTGTRTRVFTGQRGQVICSAVSAEGRWFAIGSDDHTLRIWNWQDPAPAVVLPLYNRHITCCSAAADGSILAAGFHEGTIRIFGIPGFSLLREYRGHRKTITTCAISPDGTRLATVSWDGTTKLWRLPEMECLRTMDAHAGGIAALAGPAGTLIATVTEDGIARIVDGLDGNSIRTIDTYTPSIRCAAMSTDGTYLASAGANATIRIWNIRDGSLVAASESLTTSQRCCTFLPDGSALVTGGWDGTCRFFSIPDCRLLRTLRGHTSVVTSCSLSQDGTLLVTGSNDTTVRLWRTTEGEAYAVLRESRTEVSAVALSPDGTRVAAGGSDGVIRIYQLPYGTSEDELAGLPGKVTTLAFTPDGCTLAAGYDTGVCAYLSVPERKIIRTVPAHVGAVTGIAMLTDAHTLVTSGSDGICRFNPLPETHFLAKAGLEEIAASEKEAESSKGSPDNSQWSFLRAMLAARFQGEIGICPAPELIGPHDIEIVG